MIYDKEEEEMRDRDINVYEKDENERYKCIMRDINVYEKDKEEIRDIDVHEKEIYRCI